MTARQLCRVHLALAIFWLLMTIPTILWWKNSILFVGLISVYALVVSHLAAYAGSRAEDSNGGED